MTADTPTAASRGAHVPSRVERWEQRTAAPLFVLAVAFFVASVWLIAGPETGTLTLVMALVVIVTWLVFVADFVARLVLAPDKRHFLRHRWFDLASVILPVLRPFMILIYVWRLPVFERSSAALRARYVVSIVIFVLLFVYTAASLVWLAERNAPGASIVSLGDAIWWGFTTITTVGYGDFTPVTVPGRTMAVFLMLGGIVVLGVISATILSALGEQLKRVADATEAARREREAAGLLPVTRRPNPRAQTAAGEERTGSDSDPRH